MKAILHQVINKQLEQFHQHEEYSVIPEEFQFGILISYIHQWTRLQ